jgi:hypothetical protein
LQTITNQNGGNFLQPRPIASGGEHHFQHQYAMSFL